MDTSSDVTVLDADILSVLEGSTGLGLGLVDFFRLQRAEAARQRCFPMETPVPKRAF